MHVFKYYMNSCRKQHVNYVISPNNLGRVSNKEHLGANDATFLSSPGWITHLNCFSIATERPQAQPWPASSQVLPLVYSRERSRMT